MSTHPITIIQLIAGILLALAPSAIALWFLWRGSAKKRHAVLAYRALEERCRTITTLAAETWPVLEPFRGVDYTTALGVIFRDAKALNTAVASMLDYPRPARNALDAKLLFDPIEAVKFAAAREGELKRVEECLAEMDHDHATSNFRTVTPANRVGEMVGWLRNRPGQNHPNGAAFGRKDPMAGNIQFLARQFHDIMRALEDAEYPTDNPAQTILQLLNTDRSVRPFPQGTPSGVKPPFEIDAPLAELLALRKQAEKLHAQFRRTVDVCAPHAINVAFADDLAMYVRTVLEQAKANEFTRGVNHAHRQQLEEKRGRKTNVATFLQRAHEKNLIDSRLFHELMAVQQLGNVPEGDTVVTDGEAS